MPIARKQSFARLHESVKQIAQVASCQQPPAAIQHDLGGLPTGGGAPFLVMVALLQPSAIRNSCKSFGAHIVAWHGMYSEA